MGIINRYDDIHMIMSGFGKEDIQRVVSGREFAVIRISTDVINNDLRARNHCRFYPKYVMHRLFNDYTLQIRNGNSSKGRTYLCIKDKLPEFQPVEGVTILYPTIEELIAMVSGKRLIYYADFAEDRCGVDDTINEHLQKDIFNLRNENEFYLYDDFSRVQIFLQKVSDGDTDEQTQMKPFDVRNLDITTKILSKLRKESNSFYHDALTIEYELESENLQAQYFISKFHSNRKWSWDPVCIMNFRIASFIIPGSVSVEKAVDIPEDRIVWDYTNGTKYVIDSIHMDSDICSDLSEFNELIEILFFNICLA